MMVSRRRGQGPALQQESEMGGGLPPAPVEESFWSSFSVVESLFSDEQAAGGAFRGGGGDHQGSRLPFMRQLKSQEAFPPLPPSSSPYYEDYGNNHHQNHGTQRSRGGHHRRGGGGSGEWITPHTNTSTSNGGTNPPGHHLFPPMSSSNGQNYYNAFNGYNQHFGVVPLVSDGYGDSRNPSSGGTNTFSIFSDYHPRQQQHNGAVGGGSSLAGQNAFSAVPDIGVSVERHSQQQSYNSPLRGVTDSPLGSSPTAVGYLSPSMTRKRNNTPTTATLSTTIIAPPTVSTNGSGGLMAMQQLNSNKICCDDKALLLEDSDFQSKGLPFSLLLALPNEHLLKILSYLSGRDLANLQIVGKKRLAILATDNGLWKGLYLKRWKLLELSPSEMSNQAASSKHHQHGSKKGNSSSSSSSAGEESSDEWAWIHSLLQQNERWKDIFQSRHSAERWRIGTLKMFNGCWGFISQHAPEGISASASGAIITTAPVVTLARIVSGGSASGHASGGAPSLSTTGETLDIFFHRKDIAPEGDWYEDWWLKDTPGVSRSQKCGYWDTFLCGRVVRYKQRAAYAQGRRPQACNISFVGDERRERMPALQYGAGGTLITPDGMVLPPTMRFASN